MHPDLYRQMLRARAYEVAVADLWRRGLISGEMHLGTGEEAVAAGVVTHLRDGDGLALAHRCSPPLVVRGVPLVRMLRELLGKPDGLGHGRAGHMHLFSREHLAGSSGVVGASLPMGAGLALAASRLRPRRIAVAFTGDGALNQGMALETLNLAVAWNLPLLVVCIDNRWAIATRSADVSGGEPGERAAAFGWQTARVDGRDVLAVHAAAQTLIGRLRKGRKPAFLLATCPRLDGHFLGDPMLRMARQPLTDGRELLGEVAGAATRKGGDLLRRVGGVLRMTRLLVQARAGAERDGRGDPLQQARDAMARDPEVRDRIEHEVHDEIASALEAALIDTPGGVDA
ncbi:MAG: thiamine pyrophosphate-dependent dehydrogenase E1 component subunit alpha [Gemmatimonadota bacterium]|nr:thiamine pyrophosphate-dependent dehydrogenase E1 component subunit alpha [Gemmatimonadota bacterium]